VFLCPQQITVVTDLGLHAWRLQGGKSLLVPTPRPRTGLLSEIQLPEDCDEETLSKYSTRQVQCTIQFSFTLDCKNLHSMIIF